MTLQRKSNKVTNSSSSSTNNKKPKKRENQDLDLKSVIPITASQECVYDSYQRSKNLVLHGYAGTGKTYISLYLSLEEILSGKSTFDKIIIIRSAVQSRDMGFLPGDEVQKAGIYELPYIEICSKLFRRGDAYELLKKRGTVHFTTTSFLRGITFENAIVIVDEIQNMTFQELDTITTRLGDKSKIILCGDYRQSDLLRSEDKKGLRTFLSIIDKMQSFDHIEFMVEDIVRSGVVREFIMTKAKLGL